MPARKKPRPPRIDVFDFTPGRVLARKYRIESRLGSGWEGEVYRVTELRTGLARAAKLFFPHRNPRDRAVKFYARKLDRLRHCPIVIQYHSTETILHRRQEITVLVSEFVEGEILGDFLDRQRGKRLPSFEALHLLYTLARGVEVIHEAREYHGDIHYWNIMVKRRGIFFDVKLVDFYQWGTPKRENIRDDVVNMIHLLHDAVGGAEHYASQPPAIKGICRGLRRDLITSRFPTARHLRHHLETFLWKEG